MKTRWPVMILLGVVIAALFLPAAGEVSMAIWTAWGFSGLFAWRRALRFLRLILLYLLNVLIEQFFSGVSDVIDHLADQVIVFRGDHAGTVLIERRFK